ncbi:MULTISPECIES: peroxide-responsive transcriptional repressor PerR [unclassified Campylobacter]|uniref:peroxide-responsive transcriptional repressor PerR n=1 Tax=unclassified Campylobacter TaxID=2593542 RepID=UPI001237CE28|nr:MULTISPECIES: peroxide-responsive transcriptional repressor PerR [unclassified Campylobacter]KAA6227187.1 peroxide-responsive transcriptional repressor PerR [Campylobacter sp. LR286c]KAA6227939.1 peroxide-responsive transcriptional repressor PerR [Campylobacter sp. LR185c]KAA6228348.1 peroxide-responsive transcriptional repressor PerR [Campylobacter sp. LR196d]KAA6229349.1 peroxide-responsive transcriptional repressor PerR [Campylobacter sp. LR291e]KAA6231155.1 peroxide-responsive transcrip
MELLQILKSCELKATPQRLCVLKILKRHEHPNIDELYSEIKKEYPSISLATVYKNLNTLQEQGLVVEINVANQKTCYDIYEEKHIHIICQSCGHISDMSFEEAQLDAYQEKLEKKIGNFIEHLGLCAYVKTCKKCQ